MGKSRFQLDAKKLLDKGITSLNEAENYHYKNDKYFGRKKKKQYSGRIYQLKITIKGSKPPIWRRILIKENATFYKLHKEIQYSFGWENYHLHNFIVYENDSDFPIEIGPHRNKSFGIDQMFARHRMNNPEDTLDEERTRIKMYFTQEGQKGMYLYDFGDNWEHLILLEKIYNSDILKESFHSTEDLPFCIDGKRAGPPEDSGGIFAYNDHSKILKNKHHPECEELIEWYGEDFDPESINCKIFSVNILK